MIRASSAELIGVTVKKSNRGRLITPTVITPTVITLTVISPTLVNPTVITPTLINTPTMHPGLYHHILSNRNSKQL